MTRDNDTEDGITGNGSVHGFPLESRTPAVNSKGAAKCDDSSFRSGASQGSEDGSFSLSFYGIALMPGVSCCDEDEPPLVFSDRKEALRCAKKYKGARFKAFPSREEAVAYCERSAADAEEEVDCAAALVGERPSSYRGPKSQDVVRLRKAIECGDAETVRQCVWANPRYLISSGDTPTVMQEGFRYNAMHVTCMRRQPAILQLILETIEDPKFLELLYPDDTEAVRQQRTAFLVDLYLNMPDKGRCETPLHFACKFGCARAVEILLSHHLCDRTRTNKYGQTARDIICERITAPDAELRKQIESYFEDRFFVPVLRSEDNSVAPLVGQPFSPDAGRGIPFSGRPPQSPRPQSPRDPSLVVVATVGPMSPTEAEQVYKSWKTPPRRRLDATSFGPLDHVRLSDPEKGLERVGRNIAKELSLPWSEFWPFLGTWCNLSSSEGLSKLEAHLRKMHVKVLNERRARENETFLRSSSADADPPSNGGKSGSLSPMSQLCWNLGNFHVSSISPASTSTGSDTVFYGDGRDVVSSTPAPARRVSAKAPARSAGTAMETEASPSGDGPWVLGASQMVAQQMLSVLYDAIIGGKEGMAQETTIGAQLAEQVLTDLGELERSLSNLAAATGADLLGTPAQLHGHLARLVYDGLRECAVPTERMQLCFCLRAYLSRRQSTLSPPSTDDEDEDAPMRFFRKPTLLRRSRRTLHRHLQCVLHRLCVLLQRDSANADDDDEGAEPAACRCSWPSGSRRPDAWNGEEYGGRSTSSPRAHLRLPLEGWSPLKASPSASFGLEENGEEEDMDEAFYTPPSSGPASSSSSPPSSELHTPDEAPEVFMQGKHPSKVDLDVLRALEFVSVDPVLYPCVYQWKQLVLSFPEESSSKWQSPCAARTRRPFFSDATRSPLAPSSDGSLSAAALRHPYGRDPSSLFGTVPRNLWNTFSDMDEDGNV